MKKRRRIVYYDTPSNDCTSAMNCGFCASCGYWVIIPWIPFCNAPLTCIPTLPSAPFCVSFNKENSFWLRIYPPVAEILGR